MAYGPPITTSHLYPTTAWQVSCERGRMRWTETYYSATETSARKMVEYTYPGVTITSITPKE